VGPGHCQNLRAGRSVGRVDLQKRLNHINKILRVTCGDRGVLPLNDFVIQALHVSRSKGRVKRAQLIEDAAHAPYVALVIIGFVLPHLGTSIVWCSSLSVKESPLCHLGNI